ncbi:hypothetical protein MHB65_18045 [Lysinibacillus sp. FSL K6-0075]|uniref:hypothetical protein n=1 Tax=Lysinibacillus sp. FSL K6-0075 TaxID=2921415 RepID=UPI00315986A6
MARYLVYQSYMKPSKIRGELPDITNEYVANDSDIRWHYTFTKDIENAYFFNDFEVDLAKEIAELWNMKLKQLEV